MKKTLLTSRQGLTRCPSCLSHVQLGADYTTAACPFCGAGIVAARESDGGTFGHGVQQAMRTSRSGQLAAALGVSLAMSACDGTESGPIPAPAPDPFLAAPVYGGPPVEEPPPPSVEGTEGTEGTDGTTPKKPAPAKPAPPVVPEDAPVEAPQASIYGGPPVNDSPRVVPAKETPPADVYGGPPSEPPPGKPE